MEGLNTQALHGFSLKCRSVAKEKSYFVCNTDKGLKTVRKVSVPCDNIIFQHKVKEVLYNNGYVNIDRFLLSAAGYPYVKIDSEVYVATDYISSNYKEADFNNQEEFINAVKAVAKMHNTLKKANLKNSEARMYAKEPKDVESIFIKNSADLKNYKKMSSCKSRLSDFDVLFLKNYKFFSDCLEMWYKIAETEKYFSVMKEGCTNCYICHNLLKEETLLKMPDNNIFISNFGECGIAHFILDVCQLIKRYMKNLPEKYVPLSDVIEAYTEKNPLSPNELEVLKGLLLFPDKFLKICAKYYSKKRTWIPVALLMRIENIVQKKEQQMVYINEYFK